MLKPTSAFISELECSVDEYHTEPRNNRCSDFRSNVAQEQIIQSSHVCLQVFPQYWIACKTPETFDIAKSSPLGETPESGRKFFIYTLEWKLFAVERSIASNVVIVSIIPHSFIASNYRVSVTEGGLHWSGMFGMYKYSIR